MQSQLILINLSKCGGNFHKKNVVKRRRELLCLLKREWWVLRGHVGTMATVVLEESGVIASAVLNTKEGL